ncbi:hypothetical protein EUTSA_v10004856mg [Eutrema salsugineum]|uniref:Uncharacterized protein n=1 Tax=Eutrema salsugineum TaxID=72664 RepID=V4KYQ7_EUTSA|nr:uncharacterized protein LOC18012528 [Eutrema salsugineum]ESQ32573.1 hypothetical protein EUTSA_v10004856mg [Eutrema salsugineum]
MNSSSKVIMAATMVMVVSLVMVLSLVLVLLAELYCSLLLRRRRRNSLSLPTTTTTVVPTATTTTSLAQAISTTNDTSPSNIDSSPNPLTTGVLQTPKSFFQTKTHFHRQQSLQASPDLIVPIDNDSVDNFVYISNPIYSNEAASKPTTPFETPESSPSRLETGDSSSSGEEDNDVTGDSTPTLTPMKGLPEKACSVSLKDVRSLETSASESNSNNNDGSSSPSGSPSYTSPSW